ncbi:dTDP-4-dehydrorhamnose 3,5-epimerase family protein [Nocardiopsis halophila]|uniref:dTDP-4-dehydrorhamnose 3,5-epimerase family protein n=1 Tax=Nocardiopsis halophila TaxID=141692 RepID=UPI0003457CA0|nr:dTDP-4-dehydrorhamnose 3,5-epimerase family protein [Nocardiopsis halophila]
MEARELAVKGAYAFTPHVHPDERGLFVSPFQGPAFAEAVSRPVFPLAQSNHSVSRRGVVRGVHFTRTPPGTAKYVYCAHGEAMDFVIDVRVGSPTFGAWDMVVLNPTTFNAMYFPVGVGHAFVALRDETVMAYVISESYVAENELAISFFDPELGLPPLPDGMAPVMSSRDREAVTLAQAKRLGMLPDYEKCSAIEAATYQGLERR